MRLTGDPSKLGVTPEPNDTKKKPLKKPLRNQDYENGDKQPSRGKHL
jgi:hypothetical protein